MSLFGDIVEDFYENAVDSLKAELAEALEKIDRLEAENACLREKLTEGD